MRIIDDGFVVGGFTSGESGIWFRNEPTDPPTQDYISLSEKLKTPLTNIVRPYQANASKVAIVGIEHGGSGVIKENDLYKTDGLVTSQVGLALSVIAADCVPIYIYDECSGAIGLLHCGRQSVVGELIHNGIECMKSLGALPEMIKITLGPHICDECYEIGEEIIEEFSHSFSTEELDQIILLKNGRLSLNMMNAITIKLMRERIDFGNITCIKKCTCHEKGFYSFRRGDRGKQNLAYLMIRH